MSAALWPERGRAFAQWGGVARAAGIVGLVLLELALLDRNYSFPRAVAEPTSAWAALNTALKLIAYVGLFSAIAFCALTAARSRDLVASWLDASSTHRWPLWLVAHVALFVVVLGATPLFQIEAAQPPWLLFAAWLAAGAAMLAAAAFALAPLSFWRRFAQAKPSDYLAAAIAGALCYAALGLAQNSWDALAFATLNAAYGILQLYEPSAGIDAAARILSAGDFRVRIDAACSGYEGMGLVLVMMSFYLFAFRRHLRFPRALMLIPIGLAAMWVLNALRLAALVSIGAHISPKVALTGFHAQAGWATFLAATLALMAIAYASSYFRADQRSSRTKDPALHLAAAMLLPFAALMAGHIAAALFGPDAYWLAASAIVLPAAALWVYRNAIGRLLGAVSLEAIAIGALVGVLWVATEPAQESALGAWLGTQSAGEAAIWLALRIAGFALIVPIAEELPFRGYLHRALARRRFEEAAPAAFTWTAFLVTSLLFGAMHGRWLAGALAGAAFALALYRSKSLSGPITAHIAANAVIAVWAVAAERWDLL